MLNPLAPLMYGPVHDAADYAVGGAVVYLQQSAEKQAAPATTVHALEGRLYVSQSGWGLLTVPNALVRGAFDALGVAGVELPLDAEGRLNAHISVFRKEELDRIGGPDKLTERGHSFSYTLGPVKEVEPAGWPEMSKVYFIAVESKELKRLRASYGLPPLPERNGESLPFHVTIACRKRGVIRHNEISKGASDGAGPSSGGGPIQGDSATGGSPAEAGPGAGGEKRAGGPVDGPLATPDNVPDVAPVQSPAPAAPAQPLIRRPQHRTNGGRFSLGQSQLLKLPKTASHSFYLQALRNHLTNLNSGRAPLWDTQQGVMPNLLQHLTAVRTGGEHLIDNANAWERFQNALHPDRGMQQALAYLQGTRQPLVSHPLDRYLQGEPVTNILLNPSQGKQAAAKKPNTRSPVYALLQAKRESDRKNYGAKHEIMRKLIKERPDDFFQDSDDAGIIGITHRPSGFRMHLPAGTFPKLSAANAS